MMDFHNVINQVEKDKILIEQIKTKINELQLIYYNYSKQLKEDELLDAAELLAELAVLNKEITDITHGIYVRRMALEDGIKYEIDGLNALA